MCGIFFSCCWSSWSTCQFKYYFQRFGNFQRILKLYHGIPSNMEMNIWRGYRIWLLAAWWQWQDFASAHHRFRPCAEVYSSKLSSSQMAMPPNKALRRANPYSQSRYARDEPLLGQHNRQAWLVRISRSTFSDWSLFELAHLVGMHIPIFDNADADLSSPLSHPCSQIFEPICILDWVLWTVWSTFGKTTTTKIKQNIDGNNVQLTVTF